MRRCRRVSFFCSFSHRRSDISFFFSLFFFLKFPLHLFLFAHSFFNLEQLLLVCWRSNERISTVTHRRSKAKEEEHNERPPSDVSEGTTWIWQAMPFLRSQISYGLDAIESRWIRRLHLTQSRLAGHSAWQTILTERGKSMLDDDDDGRKMK